MTRTEMLTKADALLTLARKATEAERKAHLTAAAQLYRMAEKTGMAQWCERFIE